MRVAIYYTSVDGEDGGLVHLGTGPARRAMLCGVALSFLRAAGSTQIVYARLRRHSQHPHQAVAFLLGTPTRS